MQLPLDILDYIFSFLLSDRKTLFACSKDPVLSPIVGRHAFYHIIVQFGTTGLDAFEPNHLSELLSDNPYIGNHVRILQLEFGFRFPSQMDDSFAATLLMFPELECIMLGAVDPCGWDFPGGFRAALEDRLQLPTVKDIQLSGDGIPISLLPDNIMITDLSLSGSFLEEQPRASTTLPQLHSLTLFPAYISFSLRSWLKIHTEQLQSFIVKSGISCWDECLEILGVCSGNLINFDFDFEHQRYNYFSLVRFQNDLLEFSLVFPKIAQLTLRTTERAIAISTSENYRVSRLPLVAMMVNVFLPSLRYLAIDIDIYLSASTDSEPDLRVVDFSPLATVLGTASRSIPRIDLYVHTDGLSSSVTHTQLLSLLEVYEDLARSIKESVLVIHSEETAPDLI